MEALRPLHPLLPWARVFRDDHWDAKALGGPWIRLRTDAGIVDLMRRLPGIDSFEGLWARVVQLEFFGFEVRVANLDDLIRMKQDTGQLRDQYHVETLQALQALDE